jgi:polar amino acid transport system substrate-binding protein
MTKEKLIEIQLGQSENLSSLGLFVSGIAHELGNLNNCLTFNIPILRDYLKKLIPIIDDHAKRQQDFELFGMSYPEFQKDVFRILDNIEYASNRIVETGSGLREFVKTASEEKRHMVDVGKVIKKSVAVCRGQIRSKVKSFEINIAKDLPVIHTDPLALEQILVNLLINAAQAVDDDNSRVMLSAKLGNRLRDYLIIEVGDNGCGIDEEAKEKIFDPFFTTKSDMGQSGLGLFICRNLIEGLGGQIEVRSEPGEGSIIRVSLQCKNQTDEDIVS